MAQESAPQEQLEAAMKTAGISAAELARRLGCVPSLVSNWLAGRRKPGIGYAMQLHRELGLDPNIWATPRRLKAPSTVAA